MKPKRQLNLFDAVCIIVGVIVGAGIYESAPVVAAGSGSTWAALAVWAFCGATALVASLCYAELSTSFPRSGGDFVYLSEAYGRKTGNLFAWCEFWIIRPGNIGMMAYVFADYTRQVWPLRLREGHDQLDSVVYACLAVVVLTALNVAGVRSGKWTQNALTVLKVGGLLVLSGMLLLAPGAEPSSSAEASGDGGGPTLRLAILMAMFAYGGWAEMVNVAAEVRHPRKNLLRALLLGAAAVTAVYLIANAAFFHALGYDDAARSQAIAVDAVTQLGGPFPQLGGRLVAILVGVSCLGAVNAMLMTGARIIYAAGEANPALAWLGVWSHRFDAPIAALAVQSLMTLVLIAALGWSTSGFEQLLIFTSPVYWAFALLVAFSLLRLRRRKPDTDSPFRVPLYPLTPMLFAALCGFMLYSGATYAFANRQYAVAGLTAVVVLVLGVAVVWRLTPPEK